MGERGVGRILPGVWGFDGGGLRGIVYGHNNQYPCVYDRYRTLQTSRACRLPRTPIGPARFGTRDPEITCRQRTFRRKAIAGGFVRRWRLAIGYSSRKANTGATVDNSVSPVRLVWESRRSDNTHRTHLVVTATVAIRRWPAFSFFSVLLTL